MNPVYKPTTVPVTSNTNAITQEIFVFALLCVSILLVTVIFIYIAYCEYNASKNFYLLTKALKNWNDNTQIKNWI
ncbi:hypothetical protein AYR72_gp118 [Cnaphalocrocis medinalis granulovirus]|uniref:ORF131 n=1 Tax=Cnaphalocrocis medinalis granulovirus TaxID=1750712 RepID=A0A120L172_9BBAC|nr:hypothetical protein AYR72_gp118 [Cnaphalocrocis medinalis granulovirus]ALN42064.1 ORF131 [Cnaphalocrocis medinalis granulovirus]AMF83868.1 hypothetical protein [Cnaphalocrocis medinalis granulovirus]WPN08751.1 hypothetical protein [Cnaphalocrocis medinalis granulovirus]